MVVELASASSLVLGLVFIWAGASKLADGAGTSASFSALRLPTPSLFAAVVPVVELGLGGALVTGVPAAAVATIALLAAFSAVLGAALARGEQVVCGCFGAGGAEAVTGLDLVRNLLLAALALVATAGDGRWPSLPSLVVVSCAAAMARVGLGLGRLARVTTLWPGAPSR